MTSVTSAAPTPMPSGVWDTYGATVRIDAPLGRTTTTVWCTEAPHPACNGIRDALMIATTDPEGRTTEPEYRDGPDPRGV